MTATFWSHTIWYLLLGVSTIIEIFFVLIKVKSRKHVIALFFFTSGMTFSIETTIFCFLRAYDYSPMILPHSPIDDGLAGNLFSQFSITSTSLLIAVYNLKYYWNFIIAGIYGIIEELFLNLGIYSHHWYKTWMTMLGLIVLFEIVKKMRKSTSVYEGGILHTVFVFFGLFTLHMIFVWWPQLLLNIVKINLKIFPDPMTSYTFISFLNLLVLSVACMITYYPIVKGWYKGIAVLAIYGIFYLSEKFNVMYVEKGWFLIAFTIDIIGMYIFLLFIDKLVNKIKMEVSN